MSCNHPCLLTNPSLNRDMIHKEQLLGRIAGPFTTMPLIVLSHLGLVPRKTPGMFRIIHGLSFPKGDAKVKADITAFKHVPMQSLLKGMPQTSKQVVKQFSDDGKVVQPSLHMAEGQRGKHPLTH